MSTRQQLARLLPLVLLLVLVLAGLRGGVASPGFNGRLRADGPEIGIALEVVFIVCLTIVWLRDAKAKRLAEITPYDPNKEDEGIAPVSALRFTLKYVLVLCIIWVGGLLIANLHLHYSSRPVIPPKQTLKPALRSALAHGGSGGHVNFPLGPILYGLLVVVLIAAIAVSVWWAMRQRRAAAPLIIVEDVIAEEELRDAVAEGRAALLTLEDDRAAIIACYVAMERRLAERGTARSAADTPDELLARAVAAGTVRGTAAARLTDLFYEARFSSHPLAAGQREAAGTALDELAAELQAKLEPVPSSSSAAPSAEPGTAQPGGGWV
jgi:hypothetical protein